MCTVLLPPIVNRTAVNKYVYHIYFTYSAGRDSAIGIVTRCGLDGPGVECRWRARFSAPVQIGTGVHPAFYTMDTGSLPGKKRPGIESDHLPIFSGGVRNKWSHTCFPLNAFMAWTGRTLAFHFVYLHT
jgi:hypothetical protein